MFGPAMTSNANLAHLFRLISWQVWGVHLDPIQALPEAHRDQIQPKIII